MAITLVGTASGNAINGNDATITLPAGIAQNDVVEIGHSIGAASDINMGMTTAGYTELADLYANDSHDANLGVYQKVQGATPDSTAVCAGSGSASDSTASVAMVFRGVDTGTPNDATTATATGTNSQTPDPPSITTVTDGAVVVAFGASSVNTGTPTAPTNYSDIISRSGSDTNNTFAMGAWRTISPAGTENPGTFGGLTGGNLDSWCAASVALKPAVTASPFNSFIFPDSAKPTKTPDFFNTPDLTLLGQDQFFWAPGEGPRYDYPNPRAPARASQLNTWLNPVAINLIGLDQFFAAPGERTNNDYPNPQLPRYANALKTHLDGFRFILIGQDRIYGDPGQSVPQYDWPVPKAPQRASQLRTHLNFTQVNLIGLDQFFTSPGQGPNYDWPNPQLPRRAQDLKTWIQFQVPSTIITGVPLLPFDWPNPRIPPRSQDRLTWLQSVVLPSILDPNPIKPIEWGIPRSRPRSLEFNTWLQANQFFGAVTLSPFFKADWPNPRQINRPQFNQFSFAFPLRLIQPFSNYEWQVPKKKVGNIDTSWTMGMKFVGNLINRNGILLCGL